MTADRPVSISERPTEVLSFEALQQEFFRLVSQVSILDLEEGDSSQVLTQVFDHARRLLTSFHAYESELGTSDKIGRDFLNRAIHDLDEFVAHDEHSVHLALTRLYRDVDLQIHSSKSGNQPNESFYNRIRTLPSAFFSQALMNRFNRGAGSGHFFASRAEIEGQLNSSLTNVPEDQILAPIFQKLREGLETSHEGNVEVEFKRLLLDALQRTGGRLPGLQDLKTAIVDASVKELHNGGAGSSDWAHSIRSLRDRRAKGEARELWRRTYEDHLTGLRNKFYWTELTDKALKGPRRCVVVSIDLNAFKDVNDRGVSEGRDGHLLGDVVLQKVSRRMNDALRQSERYTLCRLGGDEFGLLISEDISAEELLTLLSRLDQAIQEVNEELQMTYKDGIKRGSPLRVSASFGCVRYSPDRHDSPSAVFAEADQLMYVNKTGVGGHKRSPDHKRGVVLSDSFGDAAGRYVVGYRGFYREHLGVRRRLIGFLSQLPV